MYLPVNSPRKTRLMIILAVIILALAAAAIAMKTLFSISSPHGSPVDRASRLISRSPNQPTGAFSTK